jgi:hypothetical protein
MSSRFGKHHFVDDRGHAAFYREALLGELAEVSSYRLDEWERARKRWSIVSAGVAYPTAKQLLGDDFRPWMEAVEEQLENASDSQICKYGPEFYDITKVDDCPCLRRPQARRSSPRLGEADVPSRTHH